MEKEDKNNDHRDAPGANEKNFSTRPDCKKNGEIEVDLLTPATAPESEPLSPVH